MKLAIIGSRSLTDFDKNAILRHISQDITHIISGGAQGIDSLAREIAAAQKLGFLEIEPDYAKYGRKAPLVRNREIVRQSDRVLAVWDFHSRGTAHAIVCCIEEGVPVRVIGPDGASRDGRALEKNLIK